MIVFALQEFLKDAYKKYYTTCLKLKGIEGVEVAIDFIYSITEDDVDRMKSIATLDKELKSKKYLKENKLALQGG